MARAEKVGVVVLEGPADIRDQRWLDERIADIESGVEAILEIALNWLDGRNVARLHPGVSGAEYVKSKVGPLRLGKADVTVLLAETNWSNRQIAAVAGVSPATVDRVASFEATERPAVVGSDNKAYPKRAPAPRTVTATIIDHPIEPPEDKESPLAVVPEAEPDQADPALFRDLMGVVAAINALGNRDAADYAVAVPWRRRGTTAKTLRSTGLVLGRIAVCLENIERGVTG
jgi:hypothetical protein